MISLRSIIFIIVLCWSVATTATAQTCGTTCTPNTGYPWPVCGCLNANDLNSAFATKGVVTPKEFGCKGDGVADDTACLQAALNSLAPARGTLYLNGLYRITAGLSDNGARIQGNYVGNGFGTHVPTAACPFGITVATPNIAAITATADGTVIDSLCVDHKAVSDVSGTGIAIGPLNNVIVSKSQIIGACIGIEVSGTGTTQNVGTVIEANMIMGPDISGCADLRIGHNTTGSNTTESKIDRNLFYCPSAVNLVGVEIEDAGGQQFTSNSILACGIGTRIFPGANQQVLFLFFTGTVLGDSSNTNDFLVDTAAPTGLVRSINVVNGWASSSANGPSVLVQSTGGGLVYGVHFVGFRSLPHASQTAIWFKGPTGSLLSDLTVDASTICLASADPPVAAIITDITGFSAVRGSTIGACDENLTPGPAGGPGLSIGPSGQAVSGVFTGNDIHSITNPIVFGASSSSNVIISNNGSVDDQSQYVVPSAASITLTLGVFQMSGSVAVSTMLPAWPGRTIIITPTGTAAWTTNLSGNIGTTGTASPGIPTYWIYNGSKWNIHF